MAEPARPHTLESDEITADEFNEAVHEMKPGENLVYHTGFLASNREARCDLCRELKRRWCSDEDCAKRVQLRRADRIDALADAAWQAYEDGIGVLVQHRIKDRHYEYLFIRAR